MQFSGNIGQIISWRPPPPLGLAPPPLGNPGSATGFYELTLWYPVLSWGSAYIHSVFHSEFIEYIRGKVEKYILSHGCWQWISFTFLPKVVILCEINWSNCRWDILSHYAKISGSESFTRWLVRALRIPHTLCTFLTSLLTLYTLLTCLLTLCTFSPAFSPFVYSHQPSHPLHHTSFAPCFAPFAHFEILVHICYLFEGQMTNDVFFQLHHYLYCFSVQLVWRHGAKGVKGVRSAKAILN